MVEDTRVILRTEGNMVKVTLNGLMVLSILEVGKMGNNMELVFFTMLRTALRSKVNGLKVKGKDGFREQSSLAHHHPLENKEFDLTETSNMRKNYCEF
jgi:hypothetical protein